MSTTPRLRSDAARNRERIVLEARDLFAGASGGVSLDAVARAAGVGIGTLYRHFPTKEALVDAVYSAEFDALDEEADALLAGQGQGFAAMRQWLDRYARFVATKHAMHDALRVSLAPRSGPQSEIRGRINEAIGKFLRAGAQDHSLRCDVRPDDVTLAFAAAVFAATLSPDREQLDRVLDLLMAGLRPAL